MSNSQPAAPFPGSDAKAATGDQNPGRKHKTTACQECKKKKLKVPATATCYTLAATVRLTVWGASVGATRPVKIA